MQGYGFTISPAQGFTVQTVDMSGFVRVIAIIPYGHTSTTYKLKLSGGNIKGDTGHVQASLVTEQYAHILDDNWRMNAERF